MTGLVAACNTEFGATEFMIPSVLTNDYRLGGEDHRRGCSSQPCHTACARVCKQQLPVQMTGACSQADVRSGWNGIVELLARVKRQKTPFTIAALKDVITCTIGQDRKVTQSKFKCNDNGAAS